MFYSWIMYQGLLNLVDLVSLMRQVAWQPWRQNITCKRLDRRRVKVIGYQGCASNLKANKLVMSQKLQENKNVTF